MSTHSPFQASVTLLLRNARLGRVTGNTLYWRCSAYDMDVSDRIVFEENTVVCTEPGVVPHGNSVSGFHIELNPSARWWSFTRNSLSRPPYKTGSEANWIQRETLTTDGGASYGTAVVLSSSSADGGGGGTTTTGGDTANDANNATVLLKWRQWSGNPVVGASLVVLNGSGLGQLRRVVGVGPENGTLYLDAPLDGFVTRAVDGSNNIKRSHGSE